ncbi:hypothetical protein [Acetobacter orientalis]|uniref:hypothetical protein n=1 Tax=Acetobacter orientalis TaxID=146474 RepID=UPI0039E86D0A
MARPFIRPTVVEFNRSLLPSLQFTRSLSAELSGVFVKLQDALKGMRSCVFRRDDVVLTDADIALTACIEQAILAKAIPELMMRGFLARDDGGALFSPHLYDRELRRKLRDVAKVSPATPQQQMLPCRLVWSKGVAE